MKKQTFTGIIILMSISLLGIIGVQIFWMKKALSVKKQQFDYQVNEILNRVSFRIERNQNIGWLSTKFQMLDFGHFGGNSNVLDEFFGFWNNFDTTQNRNTEVVYQEKGNIEKATYNFDTVIVTPNSKQHIQQYSEIIKSGKDNNFEKVDFMRSNKLIKSQLNELLDQMILDFSVDGMPIYERVKKSMITSVLEDELHNFNLPLKFEYAVSDKDGKVYQDIYSEKYDKKKAKKGYKTLLFRNAIRGQKNFLTVYFPQKKQFIFRSVIWLFVGSIVFTIIILITFFYTLRTIFRQKQLSEIKSDFINNMTHEFKTPIATISLAADAIATPATIEKPVQIGRFVQIIKEENKRMNRQVENVLQMALLDKRDFNLNLHSVYVHPLIEQAVKNISLQVEQRGGKIDKKLEATTDLLKIDENHFINIIYNLLDNANKYTIDNIPKIEIVSYSKEADFFITVSDNGVGMDKETQEKIFDKFYRYPMGNVHTVKGFGLGLSYVKAIVNAFGGTIFVKSEKGNGSTFIIKIPF